MYLPSSNALTRRRWGSRTPCWPRSTQPWCNSGEARTLRHPRSRPGNPWRPVWGLFTLGRFKKTYYLANTASGYCRALRSWSLLRHLFLPHFIVAHGSHCKYWSEVLDLRWGGCIKVKRFIITEIIDQSTMITSIIFILVTW